MSFKVEIEYLNENCRLEKHGNCYDVKASKDFTCVKGCKVLIPLGIKTKMHKSLRATLKPRSSSFNYWGFIQTNSVGEIEHDFGDEWKLPIYFVSTGIEKSIKEGDRVAQIRFSLKEDASFWDKIRYLFTSIKLVEVSSVSSKRSGFGSTGK